MKKKIRRIIPYRHSPCPRCGEKKVDQSYCKCGMRYYDYGGDNNYFAYYFTDCEFYWYMSKGYCRLYLDNTTHKLPYLPYTTTEEDLAKYMILL